MNIGPLILSALSTLNLPIKKDYYEGKATEYIVFNYISESAALRADDTDTLDDTSAYVHYYKKGDTQASKKAIRRLLRAAGFTVVDTQDFYEPDTEYSHVVIEVNIEGVTNDEEE